MPVQNIDVAEIFDRIANLLEIRDANPYRVRAYRNAARTVSSMARSVADMVADDDDLTELEGVGEELAGKIEEIVATGSLAQLSTLEKQMPGDVDQLLRIDGLGPKRVARLHEALGIENVEQLKQAAEAHRIRDVPGFGEKTEKTLLEGARRVGRTDAARTLLITAGRRADPLLAYLKESAGVERIDVAGSYRRRTETVGDLDILAVCADSGDIMERLVDFEDVIRVAAHGTTKSSVVLRGDLQVDLRVVPEASYGAAMHYFTGSKAHNIAVRRMGMRKGLKINEYGVFKDDARIAGKTEAEVYSAVDLPVIPPELRENRGEIEAARENRLPQLIALGDIRGDLQSHTTETDGHDSLEAMAAAAADRGYDYLAVTDHSQRVTMAGGMDVDRLARQIAAIDRYNDDNGEVRILKGCEVDILEDGSLDLPDDILRRLDLTVCAIHYYRDLPKQRQTERVLRAMDNPHFNIFAHPTGRIINTRPPYAIDMARIMRAARDRGCILELNANPEHLDITAEQCRMAVEMGVKLAISTDAHRTGDLNFMTCGVDQARRGWVRAADVVNTRPWPALKTLLDRS